MDDEQLIKLVKRNELLYNKYNKDHKSVEKKQATWRRIANELQVSEEDCVRRWTALRDRYTKESRRMTALANNGITTTKFWPFYHELDFLEPHISSRSQRIVGSSSYSVRLQRAQKTSESYSNDNDESTPFEYLPEEEYVRDPAATYSDQQDMQEEIEALEQFDTEDITNYEVINSNNPDAPKGLNKHYNGRHRNDRNKQQKRHYESDVENQLSSAVKSFKKVCDTTKSRYKNPAVHGFGQMIIETLCSMSERKQAVAMQKVTEIVMSLKVEPENV